HYALVTVSVANLRSKPGHPAELSTQATLGTPLRVWKAQRGWYYVQTPDHYLAWVDGGGIELMTEAQYANWNRTTKIIYTKPFGFAYAAANKEGATASDLVYGDILQLQKENTTFYEVQFPDGRTAFVTKEEAMPYTQWAATRQPNGQNLVQTAHQLMGLPYLWGGTSFKGVDCSGFTKTVYFMNGLVLPRDASQQVHIGEPVDTKNGWSNLQPGDLLFFGTPAKDGKPERVVHVGMWIGGNQEFIHSASKVRVSSFNASAPNYDPSELNRFLRAKRITPQAALYDLRKAAAF
ncbi:MAG: NlpC/P60 family protein, partial [Chitinophagaceae bacterium]